MNIEVKIDENYITPQIIILSNKMTDEVSNIINKLSSITQETLQAYKDHKLYILNQYEIESIYSEKGKVYARCSNEIYLIKDRLYEIENLLDNNLFIRISNSEIINFDKVKNIEMLNIIIVVCIYALTGLIFCIRNSIDKNWVNKFNQKLQEKKNK